MARSITLGFASEEVAKMHSKCAGSHYSLNEQILVEDKRNKHSCDVSILPHLFVLDVLLIC